MKLLKLLKIVVAVVTCILGTLASHCTKSKAVSALRERCFIAQYRSANGEEHSTKSNYSGFVKHILDEGGSVVYAHEIGCSEFYGATAGREY